MKKLSTLILLLFGFSAALLHAQAPQEPNLKRQIARAYQYNLYNPHEKAYLHFDNTGYFQGETIHFKVYLIRTDTERLSDLSRVLYVDLLSPNGEVVAERKVNVTNGIGRGDFKLEDLLVTGFYEIRAYTRYMTNWGQNACFSRVFPIFKEPKDPGDYSNLTLDEFSFEKRLIDHRSSQNEGDTINVALEKKNSRNGISISFYPEGGSLVNGLESRVGYIVRKKGLEIARNSFLVTPSAEKKTNVDFNENDNTLSVGDNGHYQLPVAEKDGVVLTLNATDDHVISAQLKASPGIKDDYVGYAMMHNGIMRYSDIIQIGEGQTLSFERDSLAEGVNQLTVFNAAGHILAERLLFVYPHRLDDDTIKVTTTTKILEPLKKVSFDIQARPYSSLSFSAIDASTMTGGKVGNIKTNLLLSSDLRGYVSDPEYYFEADDSLHRAAADLLMLVQGWRRYNWQEMTGYSPLVKRQPLEDRLALYGSITSKKKKLKVEEAVIKARMFDHHGNSMTGEFYVDEDGRYVFDLPESYGSWDVYLSTKKDEELANYKIIVDRHFAPEGRYISNEETIQLPVPTPNFAWGEEQSVSVGISAVDHVHKYLLPEVEVKKRSNFWKGWTDETNAHMVAVARYDCQMEAERYVDQGKDVPAFDTWYESLGSNIKGKYPYEQIPTSSTDTTYQTSFFRDGPAYNGRPIIWIINNKFWNVTSYRGAKRYTITYCDDNSGTTEFPVFLDDVKTLYISEDVEAVRNHIVCDELFAAKPVVFYCYCNRTREINQKGVRRTYYKGYDIPQYFEMDYSNVQPLEDVRRTLHWSSFTTDKEGKAHVEFYNNLNCTDMVISVEGISIDGHIQSY